MKRVLVTGASGFVGPALIDQLIKSDALVTGTSRRRPSRATAPSNRQYSHATFDIQPGANWAPLLYDQDVVVHLADGFNAFEKLPVCAHDDRASRRMDATLHLARKAIDAGVQNFVYLSTIKAMCGVSADQVLDETIEPCPTSLYGRLKLAAEREIMQMARGSNTRVIVLRFPVVYGNGADGNFTRLLKLADTPFPFPFKALQSRRSLIGLDSLATAISTAALNHGAASGTYLIHDDAISVSQMIMQLRKGLNRPARLYTVRDTWWPMVEALPKIGDLLRRLTKPLELSDDRFRQSFSWSSPIVLDHELQRIAQNYRSQLTAA